MQYLIIVILTVLLAGIRSDRMDHHQTCRALLQMCTMSLNSDAITCQNNTANHHLFDDVNSSLDSFFTTYNY